MAGPSDVKPKVRYGTIGIGFQSLQDGFHDKLRIVDSPDVTIRSQLYKSQKSQIGWGIHYRNRQYQASCAC